MGQRVVQNALDLMAVVLGRRNQNDPDSSDETFLRYLNDFISLSMPNDSKLYESFGTLSFTIDEETSTSNDVVNGTITFEDACAEGGQDFINISQEAYISLLDPENNSVSWNQLPIYQDPGEFYAIWGINNEEILISGYPTMMLYYGNEFVFRTIPNTSYLVKIYGYKKNANLGVDRDNSAADVPLEHDYWLRYVTYGACVNYARDYRYSKEAKKEIEATFKSEKKLQLAHTHNQIKMARAMPRF